MKKLLVFTENYVRGGGNRYLIDSINAVARYFDSILLVSNPGGVFNEDITRLNCLISFQEKYILSRSAFWRFLNFLPFTLKSLFIKSLKLFDPLFFFINFCNFVLLLGKLKPTAVLSCNGGYPAAASTLAMILASRTKKIPCILSIVSMPAKRSILFYPYEWLIDKLVSLSATNIILNAHAIEQALFQMRGFPKEKISIVYNGLENVSDILCKIKNKNNRLVIGCVARMDRSKGVLFLLEAFGYLAKKHQELQLVLVGNGDAEAELTLRVNKLGLKERVTLTGYYNGNINELLMSFDIFVFPSLWEGFPYSILEAMRAGCAIVATKVGGIPEAIQDEVDGLLVPPGSLRALEQSIKRLLRDEKLRLKLRSNARVKFTRNFSLALMEKKMAGITADLLKEYTTKKASLF